MTAPEQAEPPIPILVVDDELALRRALERFLESRGYDVRAASSGSQALDLLRQRSAAVMLLDLRMPGMSGMDVVSEALTIEPEIAVVILSAMTDATSAALCMQRGATDYLTKPIDLDDLDAAVTRALRMRDTRIQDGQISTWLREEVTRRSQEVVLEREQAQQLVLATLEALINALEAKNLHLAGHSARVAAYSASIATQMGLDDELVDQIRTAGRLHDLGKVGIREAVLNKSGPLTDEEFEHVKEHVTIGSQILAPLVHLGSVVDFVRSHHEHWDGSGYPDGLAGDAIPIGARVLCAAEMYDALTSQRPYRAERLDPPDAVERIRSVAGQTIDPTVFEALAVGVRRRKTLVFLEEDQPPDR